MPESKNATANSAAYSSDAGYQYGTPIVPGVCYGRCVLLAGDDALKNAKLVRSEDVSAEKQKLLDAVEAVRVSMQFSAHQVMEVLTEADESMFQMYESLLDDCTLHERIEKFLDDRWTLSSALALASQSFQEEFQSIEDDYLRARLLDVQDILLRVLDAARNADESVRANESLPKDSTTPIVLVARELFPSQFLSLPLKSICGIVCETGGSTSHAAILAKALKIPMMVDVPNVQNRVTVKDKLLVDCRSGWCFLNPNAHLLREYKLAINISRRNRLAPTASQDIALDDSPATLDGTVIKLCGNVTLFSEIPALRAAGIEEIGLYRTEFMFLIRNAMPDEDTQCKVLTRLIEGANGAPVVIRALDVGGDKPLPYFQWDKELNPSLGWRGLRFLLTNNELVQTHIRAILRAAAGRKNVKLLFPMVSDVYDIQCAKKMVREAQGSLAADGMKYGNPPIGMMLEMPSAVLALDRILPEVDFVSIGTNDLVQYLFAVDRGNSRVNQWYQQCHPIVIRLLGKICQTMSKFPDKDLEICGEMGANISVLPALIGAGLRKFSMNPNAVPNIRALIRKVRLDDCVELYEQACEANTASQVKRILDDFMESVK